MTILLAIFFNVVLFAVGAYALVRGGAPEKIGALVNLAASIASTILQIEGIASWRNDGLLILIDALVLIAFYVLSYRSTRFWPVWCFGFLLSIVAIDVGKAVVVSAPFVFQTAQTAMVYLVLGVLALGTRYEALIGRPGFRRTS